MNARTSEITGEVRFKALTLAQRWLLGTAGIAMSCAGAAAVFITENGTGSTALLIAGWLFMLAAITKTLPKKVKIGENELILGLAEELRSGGLSSEMPPPQQLIELATRYETIRSVLPSGGRRTVLLESSLLQARSLAPGLTAEFVVERIETFADDPEGKRAITLAILEARPISRPDVIELLANCIRRAKSNFEQYHALVAALEVYGSLQNPTDQQSLRRAAGDLLNTTGIDVDGDRAKLALQLSARD